MQWNRLRVYTQSPRHLHHQQPPEEVRKVLNPAARSARALHPSPLNDWPQLFLLLTHYHRGLPPDVCPTSTVLSFSFGFTLYLATTLGTLFRKLTTGPVMHPFPSQVIFSDYEEKYCLKLYHYFKNTLIIS